MWGGKKSALRKWYEVQVLRYAMDGGDNAIALRARLQASWGHSAVVARSTQVREVAGSIPGSSTIFLYWRIWGLAEAI